jgi:hypothetical protein
MLFKYLSIDIKKPGVSMIAASKTRPVELLGRTMISTFIEPVLVGVDLVKGRKNEHNMVTGKLATASKRFAPETKKDQGRSL